MLGPPRDYVHGHPDARALEGAEPTPAEIEAAFAAWRTRVEAFLRELRLEEIQRRHGLILIGQADGGLSVEDLPKQYRVDLPCLRGLSLQERARKMSDAVEQFVGDLMRERMRTDPVPIPPSTVLRLEGLLAILGRPSSADGRPHTEMRQSDGARGQIGDRDA